jgi:hypothetical protein
MSSLFDPKTRRYTAPAFGTLASLGTLAGGYDAAIKRKAYFAFHFDDIMRVNDVRKAWNRTFCDSSLWESADSDEAGHAFQIEAGRPFRFEAGHRSDLKSATWRHSGGSRRRCSCFFDLGQALEARSGKSRFLWHGERPSR